MKRQSYDALAPRPRRLPAAVRLGLFGAERPLRAGWALLAVAVAMAWVLLPSTELPRLAAGAPLPAATAAEIVSSEPAAPLLGGLAGTGEALVAHRFVFTAADGRRVEGVSYAPGPVLPAGTAVLVEYPPGREAGARIRGMRRRPLTAAGLMRSPAGLAGLALPLIVGLVALAVGLRRRAVTTALLQQGAVSTAVLCDPEQGDRRGRVVYRFATRGGVRSRVELSARPPGGRTPRQREPVLYDPAAPERAVFPTWLACLPGVDGDGQWRHEPAGRALARCAVPLLVLGGGAALLAALLLRP